MTARCATIMKLPIRRPKAVHRLLMISSFLGGWQGPVLGYVKYKVVPWEDAEPKTINVLVFPGTEKEIVFSASDLYQAGYCMFLAGSTWRIFKEADLLQPLLVPASEVEDATTETSISRSQAAVQVDTLVPTSPGMSSGLVTTYPGPSSIPEPESSFPSYMEEEAPQGVLHEAFPNTSGAANVAGPSSNFAGSSANFAGSSTAIAGSAANVPGPSGAAEAQRLRRPRAGKKRLCHGGKWIPFPSPCFLAANFCSHFAHCRQCNFHHHYSLPCPRRQSKNYQSNLGDKKNC